MDNNDTTYNSLREKLNEQSWPNVYFFKFIVPADNERIGQVYALFDETAEIKTKDSSTGKYTSVSIKTVMISVDAIIDVYHEAGKIEGIISL